MISTQPLDSDQERQRLKRRESVESASMYARDLVQGLVLKKTASIFNYDEPIDKCAQFIKTLNGRENS